MPLPRYLQVPATPSSKSKSTPLSALTFRPAVISRGLRGGGFPIGLPLPPKAFECRSERRFPPGTGSFSLDPNTERGTSQTLQISALLSLPQRCGSSKNERDCLWKTGKWVPSLVQSSARCPRRTVPIASPCYAHSTAPCLLRALIGHHVCQVLRGPHSRRLLPH